MPSPETIPLFFNEKAAAFKHTPSLEDIEQLVAELGVNVQVILPASPDDMCEKVASLLKQGLKKIIVAGGDGTVRLAAQQMAKSDCALGIIPLGTYNNFATSLRLPTDPREALRVITSTGKITEVSLGKVGERYFTEAAGVGLFADALNYYGNGVNKNLLRGMISIIRLFINLPRALIKITIDGKEYVEKVAMCTIANSARVGQKYPIAPEALLTDEVLDVVIVGNVRRREIFHYFIALKSQSLENLPKVKIEKGATITIESLYGLPVHCDDTVIGATPVTIEVVPHALKVIVPKL